MPDSMRDREIIDAELRLIAPVRRTVRDMGGPAPGTEPIYVLLDERAHTPATAP